MKRSRIRFSCALPGLLAFCTIARAEGSSPRRALGGRAALREAFEEANRVYREAAAAEGEKRASLYRDAARRYAALASCTYARNGALHSHEGQVPSSGSYRSWKEPDHRATGTNGYVLFNLGNARYRLGEYGRAIAAYRRAEEFLPRHAPTQRNLTLAREKALGGGPGREPHPAAAAFFFWHYAVSLSEAESLAALFFLAFMGVMIARLFAASDTRLGRLKATAVVTAVLAGAFVLSSGAKLVWDASDEAVVVTKEARVRSEPAGRAVELFALREGAEVRILLRSGKWTRVSLGPLRRGWVETRSLELLAEPPHVQERYAPFEGT